jgi:hypothetical protein
MNELLSHITPLTRGVIWLTKNEIHPDDENYRAIDYLLDGLLTARLKNETASTHHVLLGSSFGRPLYVYIFNEIKEAELKSYLDLLSPLLTDENDVLVIDETSGLENLLKKIPKNLNGYFRPVK